jgi:hypothetical protein
MFEIDKWHCNSKKGPAPGCTRSGDVASAFSVPRNNLL